MQPKIIKTLASISSFNHLTRVVLSILIVVILLGLAGGVLKTFFDLKLLFHQDMTTALRKILVDVLTILAVVEVLKTAMSYITDGRVKVTYIVDTVLIVKLNETMSELFNSYSLKQIYPLVLLLATLITIRVLAIRFSPGPDEE